MGNLDEGPEEDTEDAHETDSVMDLDIDSISGDITELDGEDDDPYGLGEPTPGSLAEILCETSEPLNTENSDGKEVVENEVEDNNREEEDGIDIDNLLDSL